MAILNLCHKKALIIKKFIALASLLSVSALHADTLAFFNPDYSSNKNINMALHCLFASDTVGAEDFFTGWKRKFHPKNGDNIALESCRFDFGKVLNNGIYLGYTYRRGFYISASKDFAKLYYLAKNKRNLPSNKIFDLKLKIKGLEATGIVVGKEFKYYLDEKSIFSISFATSLLYGINMQDGSINGKAQAVSKKDYNFNAISSYFYTHNYLYDLKVKKAHGFGFSNHLTLKYKNKNFSAVFVANDIFGRVFWNNLPYSYVHLNSKTKYYDKNGYVHYHPTISGREIQTDYTQKLPIRMHFQTNYRFNDNYIASIGLEYMYKTTIPYIKFTYISKKNIFYSFAHETRFGSSTLGIHYHYLNAEITCNSLPNPSTVGLNLSVNYHF